jgi:predicted RNase H-like nuclease
MKVTRVKDFIAKFIDITEIFESVEGISKETIRRSIEMIEENDDTLDDHYAEAFRMAKDEVEQQKLVEDYPEYYIIFLSALMVVLEEKIKDKQLDTKQKKDLSELLDTIEPIFTELEKRLKEEEENRKILEAHKQSDANANSDSADEPS